MPSTALVAGARSFTGATTTQTLTDIQNVMCRGIVVVLDTTVIGTGSITVTINGKDPASGKYYLLLSGAAVITNTTNRYTVYPTGIAAVANVTAVDVIPEVVQIVVTANNANAATYTVGFTLVP
jgi:hypothetical protein